MAMGRQKDGQGDLMVSWSEMPRSPGHVFYDRLQPVLIEGGFDAFAEASCRPYYAARMGAPSVPPGCYFRMHLVGYFEGIRSPVTSRSNWAKESSMLRVSRPIEVVVLNCWVTDTNETSCASNTSTILAKSASERVSRSTLFLALAREDLNQLHAAVAEG